MVSTDTGAKYLKIEMYVTAQEAAGIDKKRERSDDTAQSAGYIIPGKEWVEHPT
jgi:hypothetical protein